MRWKIFLAVLSNVIFSGNLLAQCMGGMCAGGSCAGGSCANNGMGRFIATSSYPRTSPQSQFIAPKSDQQLFAEGYIKKVDPTTGRPYWVKNTGAIRQRIDSNRALARAQSVPWYAAPRSATPSQCVNGTCNPNVRPPSEDATISSGKDCDCESDLSAIQAQIAAIQAENKKIQEQIAALSSSQEVTPEQVELQIAQSEGRVLSEVKKLLPSSDEWWKRLDLTPLNQRDQQFKEQLKTEIADMVQAMLDGSSAASAPIKGNLNNPQMIYVTRSACDVCKKSDDIINSKIAEGWNIRVVTLLPNEVNDIRSIPRLAKFPENQQYIGADSIVKFLNALQ